MSRKSAVKQTKKKDTPQCSLQHCLQIIQIRKQLTCPSMDEWIKKMWDIDIHIYIRTNTMVFDSAQIRMKFCHLQQYGLTWMVLQ